MKTLTNATRLVAAVLLVCCSLITAKAQTITGSVNGTVTDPSGSVVPNAKVTATNVETGVPTITTTNNDGIYNIRFLQIGNYKVTVESPGFTVATFGPFVLETGQNAKVDVKLVLGSQATASVSRVGNRSPFEHRKLHPGDDPRYPCD